jgi:hypothetical protein
MHSIEDNMFMFHIFLSWCGVFTVFDLVFLFVGVFLQGDSGTLYVLLLLGFCFI